MESGLEQSSPGRGEHVDLIDALDAVAIPGRRVSFAAGDSLRSQGHHYTDALLLIDGAAEVRLESANGEARTVEVGPGLPIGEIGYLYGMPATASVTATRSGSALLIDDDLLTRVESTDPDTAAALLRKLALSATVRLDENEKLDFARSRFDEADRIEVKLCRTPALLERAQALRFEVYCKELGRRSPFADEATGRIADPLDEFGHTFIAFDDDDAVGTIRTNFARDGDLGVLKSIYGLRGSEHYPDHLGACTKFVIRRAYRGGPLAMKLIAAATRFGLRHEMRECYIDTIPPLEPYYRAMGFSPCGEPFFHRENGLSIPMRLDLVRYGKRLTREPSRTSMARLYIKAQTLKRLSAWRGSANATEQSRA